MLCYTGSVPDLTCRDDGKSRIETKSKIVQMPICRNWANTHGVWGFEILDRIYGGCITRWFYVSDPACLLAGPCCIIGTGHNIVHMYTKMWVQCTHWLWLISTTVCRPAAVYLIAGVDYLYIDYLYKVQYIVCNLYHLANKGGERTTHPYEPQQKNSSPE